jgi:heme oxygenase (biliverdin-IX-beta and delta-forming)
MSSPGHFGSNTAGRRDGVSWLHQQLRRETAGLHKRLEAKLGFFEPEFSIHRYVQVLQIFRGFYAPVEASLLRLTAVSPPLGFPLRARSELIESDLLALGLSRRDLAELPRCTNLPRLSCPEDLAGCLYVLEGACLGGQVIAPTLRQRLGVDKDSGASFFVGDAEATSARWTLVLTWLDALVCAGARSEEVAASACATFSTLTRWVEQQGASQGETPWSI